MFKKTAGQSCPTLAEILAEQPETQVVNLTEKIAMEEAEAILATCKTYPYAELFSLPSERRRLLRYVMNRVNRVYVVAEPGLNHLERYSLAFKQRLEIRTAIWEGIHAIAGAYFKPKKQAVRQALSALSQAVTP